jgi:hypothetical protein
MIFFTQKAYVSWPYFGEFWFLILRFITILLIYKNLLTANLPR